MPHIPYRMRPSHKSTYGNHEEAQIHASLAGCDFDPDVYIDEITMLKSTHPVRDATAKYSVRLCKKTTFRISIFYFLIQTDEMNK